MKKLHNKHRAAFFSVQWTACFRCQLFFAGASRVSEFFIWGSIFGLPRNQTAGSLFYVLMLILVILMIRSTYL